MPIAAPVAGFELLTFKFYKCVGDGICRTLFVPSQAQWAGRRAINFLAGKVSPKGQFEGGDRAACSVEQGVIKSG
jgi:hypothetical protein